MSALFGTWTLVAEDRCLQGSSSNHSANTTIAAGLPNVEGSIARQLKANNTAVSTTDWNGALGYQTVASGSYGGSGTSYRAASLYLDNSKSNSVYGGSTTVQPPAYVVNVWRRIA